MTDQYQAQFKTEGQPAFPVEKIENDNSTSSPEEKTNSNQTQSVEGEKESNTQTDEKNGAIDEDKKTLADHPRWKEREQDWTKRFNEQEARHVDEIAKLRQDLESRFTQTNKNTNEKTNEEIPEWFGGDEVAWKKYSEYTDKLVEKAVEKSTAKIRETSEQEQKRIDEATKFFDSEVAAIESDRTLNPSGDKIDRNKLLKVALDNKLTDLDGHWNYRAAYLIMRASNANQNASSIEEKKKIAGISTSNNKAESKPSVFSTSEDFQNPSNRPW